MTAHPAGARRPSAPWFGGLAVLVLWIDAAVLLSYTLLDLRWQQALGAWNYWLSVPLIALVAVLFRVWRGDDRR